MPYCQLTLLLNLPRDQNLCSSSTEVQANQFTENQACNKWPCKTNDFSEHFIIAPVYLTRVFTLLFFAFFTNQECMFGIYKVLISVFLYLTVWLKPKAISSFCEQQYVRLDPTQMQIRLLGDFLSVLFLVLVHRNITLNGSLGFPIEEINKNTKAIDYNRHTFFLKRKT